jgi:REP element-mobilizing transposase RayT
MWNNTEIPLAHFITFRSYGTWLHGDERGSVDRHNNGYGDPYYDPNAKWKKLSVQYSKAEPVVLNAEQRKATEAAIRETCEKRGWSLLAVNIRTNHVHSVVSPGSLNPSMALNGFKANATRMMRESGCWKLKSSPWAAKGSKRRLWNERHIELAIDYVINGQGEDLPDFDF